MKFRYFFFWLHLVLGLTVGLLIFWFALTGLILAFEPQIIACAESGLQKVVVPANGSKASLDILTAKVQPNPQVPIVALTVFSDASRSIEVEYSRNHVAYLNSYTGEILGQGTNGLRTFFDEVTALHRWLGTEGPLRDKVKTIKGIVTILFGLSILTGAYIWWPRQWTPTVFKVIGLPQLRFSGRQRDFNWHNAFGFWSAPWLLIIVTTGLIMVYPWANNLLYRAFGDQPPPQPMAQGPKQASHDLSAEPVGHSYKGRSRNKREHHEASVSLDAYLAAAIQLDPQWKSINLRLPQGNRPNVMAVIEDPSSPNPYGRSLLTLDKQGQVVKWEPYQADSLGRKARIWVRALHTGEAGGLVGQIIAALAVVGAMTLVWTGFALSWRRFFSKGLI